MSKGRLAQCSLLYKSNSSLIYSLLNARTKAFIFLHFVPLTKSHNILGMIDNEKQIRRRWKRKHCAFRQQKDYCDCVRYEDEPLNPFHKASLTLLTSLHFNFALHLPTPTLLHWTCLYGEYDITGWRGLSRFKDFCKCSSCFGKKASRTLSLKAKHIKRKNNGIFTWCFCSGVNHHL